MSQMSQLERHARTAAAISLMNRLRHQMKGRPGSNLDADQFTVLADALDMSRESRLSHKTVKYSFRGLPDGARSAALQLSEAFLASFVTLRAEGHEWKEYLHAMRTLIDTKGELLPPDRERVEQFAEVAIEMLGSQSGHLPDSPFRAKNV